MTPIIDPTTGKKVGILMENVPFRKPVVEEQITSGEHFYTEEKLELLRYRGTR